MFSIKNLKLGVRLGAAFGIVVLLTLLVGGVGMMSMSRLNESIERIAQKDWNKARLAMEIEARARANATRTGELFIVEGEAAAKHARTRIGENAAFITKNFEELDKLIYLPEGKAVLAKLKELRGAYVQSFGKVLKLMEDPKNRAEAARLYQTETMPALDAFMGGVANLVDLQKSIIAKSAAEAAQVYDSARMAMAIAVGLSLVLAVVLALLITRSITGPVLQAVAVAEALARGDLTQKIEAHGRDEIGQLLDALGNTTTQLEGIVAGIKDSSEVIGTAAREIAMGNTDLSSRTEEQASSLEETASSMEELTSTVQQNAENAKQANQLAAGASEVAVRGGEVVGQVVTTMSSINESSKKIADIISVIDGIAFQTNILALNAAVEAARAGEQGRGFAVVASEVRNLAQRSAAAAKEIKDLITDSVAKVATGTQLVDQAGKTIGEVVTSVKRVTDVMAEITAASREQSTGIGQVNQAVTQMDEVTQQNAALVEQAAAAAESMQEQAEQLAKAVSVFKLSQERTHASAPAPARASAPKPAANVARLHAKKPAPKAESAPAAAAAPAAGAEKRPAPRKAAGGGEWTEF